MGIDTAAADRPHRQPTPCPSPQSPSTAPSTPSHVRDKPGNPLWNYAADNMRYDPSDPGMEGDLLYEVESVRRYAGAAAVGSAARRDTILTLTCWSGTAWPRGCLRRSHTMHSGRAPLAMGDGSKASVFGPCPPAGASAWHSDQVVQHNELPTSAGDARYVG